MIPQTRSKPTRRQLLRPQASETPRTERSSDGRRPIRRTPIRQYGATLAAYELPSTAPPIDSIAHLVRRTSFGVDRGALAEARAMGKDAWLDRQLHPERIDDDLVERLVEARTPSISLPVQDLYLEPEARHTAEFLEATLLRIVLSNRQLQEVMVDFWSNHFNIYMPKGESAIFKIVEDRELIRPHALGRFRDLLGGSAKSPAMLFYLDNNLNVKSGPNENYAREVMELHSLGVDGGYTQKDVQQLARILTGWTFYLRRGAAPGEFFFSERNHDPGTKVFLGEQFLADGINEGERVLDILAAHPSTADFIARKLCQRFVDDEPPESIVQEAARSFLNTDGDIRAVVRTILTSDEFYAAPDRKVQRPLELVASVLRSLGAQPTHLGTRKLLDTLQLLDQVPHHHLDPDGYPDEAAAWVSSDGLLTRWNFIAGVVQGSIKGFEWDLDELLDGLASATATGITDHLADRVLHRTLDASDRATIIAFATPGGATGTSQLGPGQVDTSARRALVGLLSSPYFQLR